MTTAEIAVHYILSRIARDVNFAWYMFGTQALALCYEAEFERTRTQLQHRDRRRGALQLVAASRRRRGDLGSFAGLCAAGNDGQAGMDAAAG